MKLVIILSKIFQFYPSIPKIPRYLDTKIPRYQDNKIPRYQDTKVAIIETSSLSLVLIGMLAISTIKDKTDNDLQDYCHDQIRVLPFICLMESSCLHDVCQR